MSDTAMIADTLLDHTKFSQSDKFDLLNQISQAEDDSNDLAVLVAMRLASGEWDGYEQVASSYIRSKGLFPYLPDSLSDAISFRDALAKEVHKSDNTERYMHRTQFKVLHQLLSGKDVILSAPTSFGKSFLIEELLKTGNYKNVLVVVPTVALIEEFRKKVKALHLAHKRISFTNQIPSEQNIFILTQERAFEMYGVIASIGLDLLIIDEFYKMDNTLLDQDDSERSDMLSVVYRKFSDIAKQVYLLGPYIDGANGYDTPKHKPVWIECKDNTTYIIKKKLEADRVTNRDTHTLNVILKEKEDIMIYLSSPSTLRNFYKNTLKGSLEETTENNDLIDWISENIGPEWYLNDALRHGVGVHHGQIPRFLAHEMIKRFSEGKIKILLCTSSLIEGVNTSAKTIVIHNGKRKFNKDILTFRNISGRAGRMFKHFWGTVYYFEEPVQEGEIIVNDPIGAEDSTATPNILGLLEDNQLTKTQRDKLSDHRGGTFIPFEILNENHFIDYKKQESVIQLLRSSDLVRFQITSINEPSLTGPQLTLVLRLCSLLGLDTFKYAHAIGNDLSNSILRLKILIESYFHGGFKALTQSQSKASSIKDDDIEESFRFLKYAMNHDLPKYIRALDRLQKYTYGHSAGSLDAFAARVEFLDTKPVYIQLDELGLPIEFSVKYKLPSDSTEDAVSYLSHLIPQLSGFEKEIATEFIKHY